MPDHLDSVKALLRLHRNWLKAAEEREDEKAVVTYRSRIAALDATINELDELRRLTKPIPSSYGDLSDLPAELMKELSGIKVDDLEQQIYTIMKSGGEEIDLDAVLIELFRRFKIVQTRKYLQNKLWRMAQKGVIFSVPGKKGIYSAIQPTAPAVVRRQPAAFETDLDDNVPF